MSSGDSHSICVMQAFSSPPDQTCISRKRTLDAFIATERWVRATRMRLQDDLYGTFSFFSTLPLELLYCVLRHLLRHDLANPTAPWASLGLLSTCRDARALLPAWVAHAHRTMGGIPTQQDLSLQFYMKALGRLRRAQFRAAGCNVLGVRGICQSNDLALLHEHHYTEAVEWVVGTAQPCDALHALMCLGEAMPGEHSFVVQQATRVAAKDVGAFCRYLGNWYAAYKHDLLERVVRAVLGARDAWVLAFNFIATPGVLRYPNLTRTLLQTYRAGLLQSWEGLAPVIHPNLACMVVRHAPALLHLPLSATDASPNPLVRQHLLVCASATGWEQLRLQGVTLTPRDAVGPHVYPGVCPECFISVDTAERLRRLHARGCVIAPSYCIFNLLKCIDVVVACAHVFAWPDGPTVQDLDAISRLKGARCKGMVRLHQLCRGAGEWAQFVAQLKDKPLRRKLAPLAITTATK